MPNTWYLWTAIIVCKLAVHRAHKKMPIFAAYFWQSASNLPVICWQSAGNLLAICCWSAGDEPVICQQSVDRLHAVVPMSLGNEPRRLQEAVTREGALIMLCHAMPGCTAALSAPHWCCHLQSSLPFSPLVLKKPNFGLRGLAVQFVHMTYLPTCLTTTRQMKTTSCWWWWLPSLMIYRH